MLRGHLQDPELLQRLGVCPEGGTGASRGAVAGETWLCAKCQLGLTPAIAGYREGEVGYNTKGVLQAEVDNIQGW